jgi:hypothetical protein
MSTVQIIETKAKTYPNLGRYFFAELSAGKHKAMVTVAPNYLQVIVQNASNRAWRGMGKRFTNTEAALAAYKTAEIRAMIQAAADLSAAA